MELILKPDCSLLHLHSNDINSLKFILKKKEDIKKILIAYTMPFENLILVVFV